MNQNGIALPNQVDRLMMRQEERGQTAVLVAIQGNLISRAIICLNPMDFSC